MATGTEARFETSDLMAELRRYLIAVDAFRAEGREPVWRREERGLSDWTPVRAPGHRAFRPPAKETEV